ncbi:Ubiquitin-activating enzyme E1 1-like protein [Forsythia ovata]|uniref:Ubiquitin-activating enzyme E1 1-like protein n=1 Tax=Forsythia ovata TaxID=205694 RepID=A0ABD1XEF2_9LAMI
MCIVQSFPHNIDHCLTWASSEFEGLFEKTPAEVNTYLSSPSDYISAMKNSGDAQARDNLERVLKCLDRDKWDSFEDCITWARFQGDCPNVVIPFDATKAERRQKRRRPATRHPSLRLVEEGTTSGQTKKVPPSAAKLL